MNKKVKALIGSSLAIAMSASIAAGGTFALFTDKAEVNVAITAGTVDVNANVNNLRLYSFDRYMGDGVLTFENLGMADLTGNTLTLTYITPGDKVEFDLNIESMSNVKTKVRTVVADKSEDDSLMKGLVVKVNGVESNIVGSAAISEWKTVNPADGLADEDKKMTISIELPDRGEEDNQYQGKIAKLAISIEAVQWNGDVADPIPGATNVSNANQLESALARGDKDITVLGAIDGETLVYPWGETNYPNLTAEYFAEDINSLSGGEIVVNEGREFGLFAANTATIKDMTITGNSEASLYIQAIDKATAISDVVVNANGGAGIYSEYSLGGVTIDNATVKQNGISSTYEPWFEAALAVANGSQVVVNSGYYESSLNAISTFGSNYQGQDSVVTINGGTFIGNINVGGNDSVIVNGGTFSVNPSTVAGVEVNGVIVANEDGTFSVYKNAQDAMTVQKKDIVVELFEDTVLDVTAWEGNEYSIGGGIIETITVNGNGHTLTFNQKNSDWNNIATNGAKLIINDANITNSGYNNGPWNRHDINFACDVELKNVNSDKALAFKAGATLTNVVIDDANTSDTYAIWIQPNGQTVNLNNVTIDMLDCTDGRGIKIDEQYVTTPKKVVLNVNGLTVKSEEKSAILVKSVAGAEINITNIDISGVVADSTNAVWVDSGSSAYYDLVVVNGATKAQE
ncbi:MAG: hypothetical protein E7353_08515 [Clostridiales bacterium]|nr:hypothetical protein [Clostridiales bacterium]